MVSGISDTLYTAHLTALNALCCELLLVALGAVDVVLLRDEALGADGVLAGAAHEALLVPLPGLVLHLLHARLYIRNHYWNIYLFVFKDCIYGSILEYCPHHLCSTVWDNWSFGLHLK